MRRFDKKHIIESANKRLENEFIKSKLINEADEGDMKMVKAFSIGLDQQMKNLPKILDAIVKADSDKNLDIGGDEGGEGTNEGRLNVNEEKVNEIVGTATLFGANLVLNAPSIIKLTSKLAKKLGKDGENPIITKIGLGLEHVADSVQDKYMDIIGVAVKKFRPDLDDEALKKVSRAVFTALLTTVGISTLFVGGIGVGSEVLGGGKLGVAADRGRDLAMSLKDLNWREVLDTGYKLSPKILTDITGIFT